jgi:hypothetical protein
MTTPDLGKLEPVPLRDAWVSEPADFTPWLADNLPLLGETLGLSLELVGTEQSVGPFSADILCREATTDHVVLIENQLEQTDHTHLGQIITYAAGLDALTVIWVAATFVEQHRAALDWLNQNTSEDLNFFGIEVQLWRIGTSRMAPRFNIVSKPNAWAKQVRERAPQGPKWDEQRFFADLAEKCPEGVAAARSIFEWSTQRGHRMVYGNGAVTGAFVPWISAGSDLWYQPVVVFSDGRAAIGYDYIKAKPIFNDEVQRDEMRQKLNAIDGVAIPKEKIGGEPSIPLALLADQERMKQFLAVLDWFTGVVRGEGVGADGQE